MSSQPPPPAPEIEDELAAFRREWQEETKRRQPPPPSTASTSTKIPPPRDLPQPQPQQPQPTSPKGKSWLESVQRQLDEVQLEETQIGDRPEPIKEKERERPKSALDLYSEAVKSEQEGRLNDGELPLYFQQVQTLASYLIA